MREKESGGRGGRKKIMQKISSGRSDASFMLITLTQADQSGLIHHHNRNSQQFIFGENAKLSTS